MQKAAQMKSQNWTVTLGIVIILVFAATWVLSSPNAANLYQQLDLHLIPPLALLLILGAMVVYTWSGRPSQMAKSLLIWAGVSACLAMGFIYREDLKTVASGFDSEWTASATETIGDGVVSLRAAENGHFFASAMVNGTHVDFLVDTGATIVALTEFDALRLGFNRDELIYDRPLSTANGQTLAAGVMLDQITIGDIEITNVRGAVLEDGLEVSLLGMTFLNQLGSFTVDQDRMIMRQ